MIIAEGLTTGDGLDLSFDLMTSRTDKGFDSTTCPKVSRGKKKSTGSNVIGARARDKSIVVQNSGSHCDCLIVVALSRELRQ